ncbi:hypothetical protein [Phytomonospora endophytica]|uniref:Uncharacterized protein n=1 Tax=Phytomonospora endophytica TaxID=714109 RepID=A0A841FXS5_9ACTN|nr:hypothetical protein [Phytomonospora endophytica]MBB6039523.1 hypothetical protein [Phytomonospora endophytica]GIG70487.1 hypothetical protein Pen01_67820 [Phytomonospora endophytica]
MNFPKRCSFPGAATVAGRARQAVRCEQHQGRECLSERTATWLASAYGLQRLRCAATGSWHVRNAEVHRRDRVDARMPMTLRLVSIRKETRR